MTDYYAECLKKGLEYQDFVFTQLRCMEDMPVFLGAYSSKKYQYEKGESLSGLEIKYDTLLNVTGNLFIEYQEKTDPDKAEFVPSGIMRKDNSWLYLVGDYEQAFLFAKRTLQGYCQANKDKLEKKTSQKGTSWGYILPVKKVLNSYILAKHIVFTEGR